MNDKTKLWSLGILAVVLIALYMLIDAGGHWDYVIPRRTEKMLAMIITGAAIALSTVIFQTITHNRILTPSIIGLDSLYMFIQTFIVFAFGSSTLFLMSEHVHFLLTVGLMVLFSGVLYKLLFQGEGRNIYYLLLVGIVFGTFFSSISSFLQMLLDPNEFQALQSKMFASFNNVHGELLSLAIIIFLLLAVYFSRFAKVLDVLSLGKEQAINLGVGYNQVVKRMLVVVAVLVSVSTALVGPITFLGLLVANVAYQLFNTYRHAVLILGAVLISIAALVGGQLIVERVFVFSTPISVIINFIGGGYFIYLLLKERKSW
jgi:iron complex transport system permease protein